MMLSVGTFVQILTIVGIFLVAGFGEDVVLDTLLAERVHALEALRAAEVFETDLADEEFVVQFLCQADAVPAACQHPEVFFLVVVAAVVVDVGVRRQGWRLLRRIHDCQSRALAGRLL